MGLLTAQVVKINAIMNLDQIYQEHQLESEFVERQIEEYVIPLLSNSNVKVAQEAHVCMSLSRCQKYLHAPNAENLQQLRQQLLNSVGFALESQRVIERLVVISKMVDPVASSETQQLLIDVAESICQSSQPSIQLMGAELRDYAMLAGKDSQSLATVHTVT